MGTPNFLKILPVGCTSAKAALTALDATSYLGSCSGSETKLTVVAGSVSAATEVRLHTEGDGYIACWPSSSCQAPPRYACCPRGPPVCHISRWGHPLPINGTQEAEG